MNSFLPEKQKEQKKNIILPQKELTMVKNIDDFLKKTSKCSPLVHNFSHPQFSTSAKP